MGNLIVRGEATVGWFAGDGLMVWFNDPIPCLDPSGRAVRLAVDMRGAMAELTAKWRRRGHDLDFSVGIGLGYATLGKIGFDGRYDYGAVGTVMNLASRLCDEAEHGQILVSERVFSEIEHIVKAEPAGTFVLPCLRPIGPEVDDAKGRHRLGEPFEVPRRIGTTRGPECDSASC
jgi:adenylate cyclase